MHPKTFCHLACSNGYNSLASNRGHCCLPQNHRTYFISQVELWLFAKVLRQTDLSGKQSYILVLLCGNTVHSWYLANWQIGSWYMYMCYNVLHLSTVSMATNADSEHQMVMQAVNC